MGIEVRTTLFQIGLLLAAISTSTAPAQTEAGDTNARAAQPRHEWLPASHESLPRWRGFNLLEKFDLEYSNGPFVEEDFRLISAFGFNFVRLPMDYRTWIVDGDWNQFNEEALKQIDQAVEWGGQYGIHVCLNFHRAPGFTVAHPREEKNLWTDEEAQRVCAMHWQMFAKRYRGIPSERLSFNLFNEPSGRMNGEQYAAVAGKIIDAIREVDPDRLIICDGMNWGTQPCEELRPLKVAQATRGYLPSPLTHYYAFWSRGSDLFPEPQWPAYVGNGFLYGPLKKEHATTMTIQCDLREESILRIHVNQVSINGTLSVLAGGKEIWRKEFLSGEGAGEWERDQYNHRWDVHQPIYDQDCRMSLPEGTKRVELRLVDGDWLYLREIAIRPAFDPAQAEHVFYLDRSWGQPQWECRYDPEDAEAPFKTMQRWDRDWLKANQLQPWIQLRDSGVGVMVGEFGAYRFTPHDVTLRWMEDNLRNWQEAGVGWALWNFRGYFGVLDSGRADVNYIDFQGHQLDSEMLELLRKY
ncbi:cellulase family glycosylhydrolase [Candidatus Sumerlaeota bacterium]|nr:cellulase family glycosylhydrolase [Candidatus Sumerlaeota bacterium]